MKNDARKLLFARTVMNLEALCGREDFSEIERQLPWGFPGIGKKEAREIRRVVELEFVSYHTIHVSCRE